MGSGGPQPFEEWNNLKQNYKISNINKYLKEKSKIRELKANFLSVFAPKVNTAAYEEVVDEPTKHDVSHRSLSTDQQNIPVKRRQSFNNLFKRVQEHYQSTDVMGLTQEEFCKDVTFQFGVPLLLVDLFENLTGARILPRLREQAQTALTNIVQV